MKSRQPYSAFPFVMFVLGAGIAMVGSYIGMLTLGTRMLVTDADDAQWQTITIGDVVTFEVPTVCTVSAGTKSTNLVCPTEGNPQLLPEMTFWTEGDTVSVRRYENLETPYWDHIVASMKVIQPMTRDITVNIQK